MTEDFYPPHLRIEDGPTDIEGHNITPISLAADALLQELRAVRPDLAFEQGSVVTLQLPICEHGRAVGFVASLSKYEEPEPQEADQPDPLYYPTWLFGSN